MLFGLRNVSSSTTHDVTVRLDPPQVAVLSTFHYINHGGSEFVVYRATPADVESGVRVGNIEYRGYPASGIGITTAMSGASRMSRLFRASAPPIRSRASYTDVPFMTESGRAR